MKKKWYRLCACALAVNLLLSGSAFALELPEEDGQPEAIEAPLTEAAEQPEAAEAPLTEAAEQPEVAEAPLNEAEEQPEAAEAEEQPEISDDETEEVEVISFYYDELNPEHNTVSLFESEATWPANATTYKEQLTGEALEFYEKLESSFHPTDASANKWEIGTYTLEYEDGSTEEFPCISIKYSFTAQTNQSNPGTWASARNNDAQRAAIAFVRDYPEYYWIRVAICGFVSYSKVTRPTADIRMCYTLMPPYVNKTKEQILADASKIDTTVNQVVNAVNGKGTLEKLNYFDSWLAENNDYDTNAAGTSGYLEDTSCKPWNIAGTFIDKKAVCEGYAKAFQLLCKKVNIPCVTISGEAKNGNKSEGHMWTAVKLDGAWYLCDPTWDDPIMNGGSTETTSTKKYFMKAEQASHTADQDDSFAPPEISSSDYEEDFTEFKFTSSGFTGGVEKTTDGDLWVALYASTGKMLACKMATKSEGSGGLYRFRAPSFSSSAISDATKAVVYHVNDKWQPVDEEKPYEKDSASAMVPMEAVTASYEQLAFAASPAEIEPMEPIWGRYDALEAGVDDAALLEDSTVEWPEGALDYKAQMTGDLKLFYEQLEAAFQNNSWDVTSMGENEKAWACATVVCTGEPVILTDGSEYSAWYQQTYMNLYWGLRTLGTAFVQDHPEYFWIRSAFQYQIGQAPITMTEDGKFQTGYVVTFGFELMPPYPTKVTPDTAAQVKEEVLRLNEERQRVIDAFTEKIREETKDSNDYETVRYIDNWLSWWNRYNSAAVAEDYARSVDSTPWTIAGSIGNPGGGNSVCEGYAKGFQYLCEEVAGVPCVTIGGIASANGSPMNHMWNAVQLDGTWYFCDPTWDDLTGGDSSDYSLSSGMFFLSTSATGMHLSTQDRLGMSGVNLAVPPQATEQYKMAFNGFELKGVFFTGGKKTDTDGEIWVALYDENGAMTECEKAYKVSPEDGGCGYRAPKFPKESISGAAKAEVFHLNPQWQPVQNAPKETIDRQ